MKQGMMGFNTAFSGRFDHRFVHGSEACLARGDIELEKGCGSRQELRGLSKLAIVKMSLSSSSAMACGAAVVEGWLL